MLTKLKPNQTKPRDVDTSGKSPPRPHPPHTTISTTPLAMHFELELTQPFQTAAILQWLVVAGGSFFHFQNLTSESRLRCAQNLNKTLVL